MKRTEREKKKHHQADSFLHKEKKFPLNIQIIQQAQRTRRHVKIHPIYRKSSFR